jgi:hypothetical protein
MTPPPDDDRQSVTQLPHDMVGAPHDTTGARPRAIGLYGGLAVVLLMQILIVCSPLNQLHTDPDGYVGLSRQLASGKGLSNPRTHQPTAFRPPLLPVIYSAGIVSGLSPQVTATAVNIVSGLGLVLATWLLGIRIGLRGLWLPAAVFVAALDPLILRYTALPMTEVPSAALLTAALLLAHRTILPPAADSHPELLTASHRLPIAAFAGLAFGLCFLCRPVAAVTCFLAICYGCWLSRHQLLRRISSTGLTLPMAITWVLAAAVMTSPWLVRNRLQFDKWIAATTHGGYTLLLGNNSVFYREVVDQPHRPVWAGDSLNTWQTDLRTGMAAEGIVRGDEVAIDRWMYRTAFSEIRAQPEMFVRACWLRWKRFWSPGASAADGNLPAVVSTAVFGWYTVVWLGLAASLFVGPVRRQRSVQLLWIAVLSFVLLHTFYWTNARMRTPLAGVLSLLSLSGWRGFLDWAGVFRTQGRKVD